MPAYVYIYIYTCCGLQKLTKFLNSDMQRHIIFNEQFNVSSSYNNINYIFEFGVEYGHSIGIVSMHRTSICTTPTAVCVAN